MVKRLIYQYLLKAILLAVIVLVLYGVLSGTALATILVLFVALRVTTLVGEAFQKAVRPEKWDAMLNGLTRIYEKMTPEQRIRRAAAMKLDTHLSATELARAQVSKMIQKNKTSRGKRELCAETFGVVAFAILFPLDIALYTRDFFSIRTPQGWEGTIVAAVCVVLYLWPHIGLKSPDYSDIRVWYWILPFALGLLALNYAIQTRHPYLNPLNPDHNRLAAEKVLSLKNNIVAGRNADWVIQYAHQLDEKGELEQAIHFYREGVRLDPSNRAAYARLTTLEALMAGDHAEVEDKLAVNAMAPYWTADGPLVIPPRHSINLDLENVQGCTVVVVPIGDVSNEVLNSTGFVINKELGLPTYISPDSVPLPPYTRLRGLETGPQWNVLSIVQAFTNSVKMFPAAPVKYVLITPVDIYMNDANYVFSATYPWGAIISSARFGGQNNDGLLLRRRTAKDALGALIKSFGIPASPDQNCVTSYTQNLPEFDAKGNRPNAETMELFQQALADLNQKWQNHRAIQRLSN
jgi:predicted Zn-dependent protease